ncbi:polyadenylation factor subunit 2 [Monosporozyma servazzii]
MDHNGGQYNDGSTQKKYVSHRRTIDISSPFNRLYYLKRHGLATPIIQPETSYTLDILSPDQYKGNDRVINLTSKFTHLSSNKVKHVIPAIRWTPEGRRLIVATYNGEFSLWSGTSFNFESLMQAHDSAVTTMEYSHAGDWLVSGDTDGTIKIWQPNFNMVKELDSAHTECIRDISFSNNDSKFVSCSDDNILKIWNFSNGKEERVLKGHHWDVKSCDWHPYLGLIASGSKDNLVKLWDPRSGNCVSTILKFKHTVLKTRFQPTNGNLLVGISKDKSCRVFDIRQNMKELMTVRDEVDNMSLIWHPINESTFTVGSYDGSIKYFDILQDLEKPVHVIPYAHDKCVTSLSYNAAGNILASASKDRTIRFWARARPVDPNAYDDPTYNNHKINGWYFGINNNINAVREKSEFGAAPPAAPSGTSDSTTSMPSRYESRNPRDDNRGRGTGGGGASGSSGALPGLKVPVNSGALPGLG